MKKTNVFSQNWLALCRYGKLFRDLSLEEQEEILFDMEQEKIFLSSGLKCPKRQALLYRLQAEIAGGIREFPLAG